MLALPLGLLAASVAAEAQPTAKTYRLGRLYNGSKAEVAPALLDRLRTLGYREGQNLK